jgi:hypothetical protein
MGSCEPSDVNSGSIKCMKFLTSQETVSFSRRTLLHVVCLLVIAHNTVSIVTRLWTEQPRNLGLFPVMVEICRYAFKAYRKLIFKMITSLVAICAIYSMY